MPWIKADVMHQRRLFVNAVFEQRLTVTKLCELFDISRKSGYKWLDRCNEEGFAGLADKSRRPHSNSRAVPDDVVRRLLRVRDQHPSWGARKIAAWLAWREPLRGAPRRSVPRPASPPPRRPPRPSAPPSSTRTSSRSPPTT